jgi:hypothetical protein
MEKRVTIREQKDGRLVADYRFVCDRKSSSRYSLNDEYESRDAYYASADVPFPVIGSICIVGVGEYVGPNGSKNPELHYRDDNGQGWAGTSDRSIYLYHGWRGTTCDWEFYGMGVRRCLAIRKTGNRSRRIVIVFGRDLHKGEK